RRPRRLRPGTGPPEPDRCVLPERDEDLPPRRDATGVRGAPPLRLPGAALRGTGTALRRPVPVDRRDPAHADRDPHPEQLQQALLGDAQLARALRPRLVPVGAEELLRRRDVLRALRV